MPEDFYSKLNSGTACCYLQLTSEDLNLWNFDSREIQPQTTHQLFTAAARPHFDYFFERVDYLGLSQPGDLSAVADEKFKQLLTAQSSVTVSSDNISAEVLKWVNGKKPNAVIITDGKSGVLPGFPNLHQVKIRGLELFGNTEPVWLDLKRRLPKSVKVFFLALGPEKFLIGPRLKMRFNVPVVDVSGSQKLPGRWLDQIKNIIKL